MLKQLTTCIINYTVEVITGFESGLYKMLYQNNKDSLNLLCNKHQPFITIFRDLHESYYTSTYNSIVSRDDDYVTKTFDNFKKLSGHSNQCMLNILANLVVSIHFNLDRNKLDCTSYDLYMKSVNGEIHNTISLIDISKFFDHECTGPADNELQPLAPNAKFIIIDLKTKSNGVEKKINSFTMDEDNDC